MFNDLLYFQILKSSLSVVHMNGKIKLKEVEAKFLELSKMPNNHADVAGEPKRKRRKKKAQFIRRTPLHTMQLSSKLCFLKGYLKFSCFLFINMDRKME